MKGRPRIRARVALALTTTWLAAGVAAPTPAVDWSGVEGLEVVLFPPGQSSFEWMLIESEHSGGPKIRTGKTCRECHAGEEREIGEKILGDAELEPDPVAGQRPAIPLDIKAAHDGERLFLRLEWPAAEGETADAEGNGDPHQVSFLFTDDAVRAAQLTGCWAACHDDLHAMPSDPGGEKIRKYLGASRSQMTRSGGGTNMKPSAELETLLADGAFMELWQVRMAAEGVKPREGYLLETRHMEEEETLISATAELRDGRWVAELSRRLEPERKDRKALAPGTTYTFGVAIHEQGAGGRHHHVSLEHTLRLDAGEADLVARRQ